ncbi:hypothetical protein [Shinella pollutisoli]|uniref:Membrane protein involved in the export of O-antigen and teichoic acid n=1 Tax=Shinella pollutisoli TaxID=2250594 RepID=A0ABV7DJ98_9HYPH|nr:hypothetical protein [Shinella pollutisoli]
MHGASLSRWTMSYFAAACLFLILGQGMMAAGYGYPTVSTAAPETLALVHVVAIGWLSLLMAGALLQFVPVLISRQLVGGRFAPVVLALLVGGLLLLVSGFVALSGTANLPLGLLPLGGVVLLSGFALLAGVLAATLLAARPLGLPARFVALGVTALVATALLGTAFSLGLSGAVESPLLDTLVGEGIGLHAAFGLGGWLSLTAIGVSYRLFPMFLLAPETEKATSRAVWWSGAFALGLVAACLPLLLLAVAGADILLSLAALLTLALVLLYGHDAIGFYRARKRKQAELNIRASLAALAILAAATLLFLLPPVRAAAGENAAALVYLFVFGWLTGLGLSQLYKIVAFMTWLESYGPVLGRAPVPRVQDLVAERRAFVLFCLYYAAVGAATLSLFGGSAGLFRACVCVQLAATVALVNEFVRARRLSYVPAALRAPAGAVHPRLFLPTFAPRR